MRSAGRGQRRGQVEQLGDEELGLPDGQAAADHQPGEVVLVATWQLAHRHRRSRRQQAEPYVGLHRRVHRLDEHQAPEHPALVAAQPSGDGGLRDAVVPVQGSDQPRFLELGQPAPIVQREQQDFGLGPVDAGDPGAERASSRAPARRARA